MELSWFQYKPDTIVSELHALNSLYEAMRLFKYCCSNLVVLRPS